MALGPSVPELLGFVIAGLWVHRPLNLLVYS